MASEKAAPKSPAEATFDPALALPKKRSINIAGHRTSITLEDAFWSALKAAAADAGISVAALVTTIDSKRGAASLSAAIRVYLLHRTSSRPLSVASRSGEWDMQIADQAAKAPDPR